MSNKPFDPHKPFRTRCGWKAELLCDDLMGDYSILAKITTPAGEKFARVYQKDGRFFTSEDNPADLVNIPERIQRRVWLNVYKSFTSVHSTKEHADIDDLHKTRLACIPVDIDCEVGEGL